VGVLAPGTEEQCFQVCTARGQGANSQSVVEQVTRREAVGLEGERLDSFFEYRRCRPSGGYL